MRRWIVSCGVFVAAAIYVCAFWSRLPGYLPTPLNQFAFLHERLIGAWWREHVVPQGPAYRSEYLLWAANSVVIGLLVPLALIAVARKSPSDMGLGWPNALGLRITLAAILLSVPFGLWVLAADPPAMAQVWHDFRYIGLCGGVAMIPEHFLLCGVTVALLLPERKLPRDVPLAPVEGAALKRLLRWLGLAQETPDNRHGVLLAWLGLTPASSTAILGSGLLFLIVHIGEPRVEFLLAFPGGVAIAYMTVRCRSIWPGLLAHYALNLIPLGIWLSFR